MDWYEQRASTYEGSLGIAKAELRYRAIEVIADALERSGVSRKELAARLGVSPGRVSQVLGGDQNLRLNTLAEYLYALGRKVHLDSVAATEGEAIIERIEFQVGSKSDHRTGGARIPEFPTSAPIAEKTVARISRLSVAS